MVEVNRQTPERQEEGGEKSKRRRLLIGVTGGTASGKTSLCHRIGEGLKERISILSLDSFYRGLT